MRAAIFGLMTLIAIVLVVWQWSSASSRVWLLLLSLLPLAIPLAGLIRRQRRTFAWCSLLTIPYMALGVTELIADPARRALPATLLLLSFAWLVALVAYLRVTR